MTKRTRAALVAGVLALVGAAVAGRAYQSYAAVWLRPPGRVPPCAMLARRALRAPVAASGTEPHDDVDGQTVYLTEPEDIAVRCLEGIDRPLARRFTSAFTETEPERRGLEILKILRDMDKSPAEDERALLVFIIGSGALDGLPELPETRAAREEFRFLNACRFKMNTPCPTRPPLPLLVWLAGGPSALVIAGLVGAGLTMAGRRLVGWIRAWRARRKEARAASGAASRAPNE